MLLAKLSEWPIHCFVNAPVPVALARVRVEWGLQGLKLLLQEGVPLRPWSLGRILVFFQGQLNSHKRRAEGQEETASGSDKGAQRLPPLKLQPAASWLETYLSCPLSHF